MIGKFLMNQFVRVIEDGMDSAWNQVAAMEQRKKQKIYLESETQKLERKYAGTIIDTDDFQRYFEYQKKEIFSGDMQCVFEFLKKIKTLCWALLVENLNDSDRAAAAIQAQQTQQLKEHMRENQRKVEKSPSAAIFQRKFHKRLFLEKVNGAELAQVYVTPKCRMEKAAFFPHCRSAVILRNITILP